MRTIAVLIMLTLITACSSNKAQIQTVIESRPAVEQRALTSAMELAFDVVDFNAFSDVKSHVEVTGLTDRDLEFVRGYIENRILSVGGRVTRDINDADYRVNLVLNVIGGDRVGSNYIIFSTEKVVGEFSGRLTVIDSASNVLMSTMLNSTKAEKLR